MTRAQVAIAVAALILGNLGGVWWFAQDVRLTLAQTTGELRAEILNTRNDLSLKSAGELADLKARISCLETWKDIQNAKPVK